MRISTGLRIRISLIVPLLIAGCVTPPAPYDYTALENSRPRSILVLPPVNNSIEVNAPYTFLAGITRPLAEKGYYVFPVAVIDTFLKENGLPTPYEMNAIPLDKIREFIGADAVLYVSIEDWGQKYQLLSSVTKVHAEMRLVDVRTGNLLWEATVLAIEQSGDSGMGIIGALVGAIATQIARSVSDDTYRVSSNASYLAVHNKSRGLLHGPYFNPDGNQPWNPASSGEPNTTDTKPAEVAGLASAGAVASGIDSPAKQPAGVKVESTTGNTASVPQLDGTYISAISSNSNWQFKDRYRGLKIRIKQDGNHFTASDDKNETKISGVIEGDVASFHVEQGQAVDSREMDGEWKISPDGQSLKGSWIARGSEDTASGEWNLIKIE